MLCNKFPCTYEASHNGKCADHRIEELEAQVDRAISALEPFTHPDLQRLLGGNAEGLKSIVFQRNRAILRIGDFIQADTTKRALEQKP